MFADDSFTYSDFSNANAQCPAPVKPPVEKMPSLMDMVNRTIALTQPTWGAGGYQNASWGCTVDANFGSGPPSGEYQSSYINQFGYSNPSPYSSGSGSQYGGGPSGYNDASAGYDASFGGAFASDAVETQIKSEAPPPLGYSQIFGGHYSGYDQRGGGFGNFPHGGNSSSFGFGGGYGNNRPGPLMRPFNGDPSTISPYFGIDQNPDYVDEEKTVKTEDTSQGDLMGTWRPVGSEYEEDISSLTRDAQIIAGVVPDSEPPTDAVPEKTLEIEITVPKELITETECKLCQMAFTSNDMATLHYMGKNHAKKENHYVRKIYEEKGINVSRFLHRPKQKVELSEAAKAKNKFKFNCRLCSLSFESQEQVDQHVLKPGHKKNVKEYHFGFMGPNPNAPPYPYRGNPFSPRGGPYSPRGRGGMRRGGIGHIKQYMENGEIVCLLCTKTMNSEGQWDLHSQSKRHMKKVEEGYY